MSAIIIWMNFLEIAVCAINTSVYAAYDDTIRKTDAAIDIGNTTELNNAKQMKGK